MSRADHCPVRIIGYLALLWGGLVVGYTLTLGLDSSGSRYAAEAALGAALFVAGWWILVRRARSTG